MIIFNGIELREIPGFPGYYMGADKHAYTLHGRKTRPMADPAAISRNALLVRKKKQEKALLTPPPPEFKRLAIHYLNKIHARVTLYSKNIRMMRRLRNGNIKSCVKPVPKYINSLFRECFPELNLPTPQRTPSTGEE